MPDHCCVPGCKSNYYKGDYASVFNFPKDEARRKLWLRKIPRGNYDLSKRTVICEKHFRSDMIIRTDFLPDKDGKIVPVPRKRPLLKEDAYPCRFDGCLEYLSEKMPDSRESRDEMAVRREKCVLNSLLEQDKIGTFSAFTDSRNEHVKDVVEDSTMILAKRKREQEEKPEEEPVKRISASIVLPIRQTASIFKQSVTVFRNQESKVNNDLSHGPQDKPKQVFWEKRLQGIHACDKNGKVIETFELPAKIKAVGLQLGDETILRSITTALHMNGHPITGQNKPKALLDKSPGVYINPSQPLVLGLHVTEEDIEMQEKRVLEARERLKEALNE